MNSEDKAEYHNSLIKNITRKCHEKCFKSTNNNFQLDKTCLTGCYHKYINVMSKLRKLSFDKGAELDSQFVNSVYSLKDDAHLTLIWGRGGSKYMHAPPMNWCLKYLLFNTITPYKGYSPFRDKYENQ